MNGQYIPQPPTAPPLLLPLFVVQQRQGVYRFQLAQLVKHWLFNQLL